MSTSQIHDLTGRVQAAQAPCTSQDTLRALHQQIETAREQERTRIAKEIHDELVQPLTYVLYQADLLDIEPEKVKALAETLEMIGERCRTLIRNLYPPELDWPLAEVVQALPTGGVWLQVDVRGDRQVEAKLPAELKLALYRVIQEAVSNAAKHARASQITARLDLSAGSIHLEVIDDGCGFEVARLEKPERSIFYSGGFGLGLMRERIDAWGGELHIASQPGSGTRVRATIPLPT